MKPHLPLAIVLTLTPALSGCIAWEIRDEIHATNQHLSDVKPTLVHTLNSVDQTNREIDATQAQLTEVQAAIAATQTQIAAMHTLLGETKAQLVAVEGTLVQTNPKLNDLDGGLNRMQILNEVHASLKETNSALGPLNTAIGSLGGAMSFFGMGSDSSTDLLSEEPTDGAAAPAGAEPDAADASPATGAGAAETAAGSKRPDPLLGTWVLVYPPPRAPSATPPTGDLVATGGHITVITADGKFLMSDEGQPPRTGQWSRKGRSLTFALDAPPGGAAPAALTLDILTLNSRTMTVRYGNVIRVHARP